ncbi:c-type cytochrome [Hydrogenophaga sp.]|uniref:c-type cytochrome n=1 Tax=Hydrogenophaga sp. TaxID=1904254 RepID=UPI00391BBDFB
MSARRSPLPLVLGAFLLGLLVLAAVVWWQLRGVPAPTREVTATPALIARGEQLARAGNCMACHTARGGEPWSGGHVVKTPFGDLVSSNLTPDPDTGLGGWSAGEFWRALHHGQSRDGRLLYPAFPYTHTTLLQRDDVDALYAYLRTLAPVRREHEPHRLRFPYNTQAALALWRAMYFEPGEYQPDTSRSADWNQGAYLVRGVAHCAACHAERSTLGGSGDSAAFGGSLMPSGDWWAPSLRDPAEAGVQDWSLDDVVALLRTGRGGGASTLGPMAEVVLHGTQHLPEADLRAMAVFLKDLPVQPVKRPAFEGAEPAVLARGGRLYDNHCAQCHGDQGQGAQGIYPPLAGHRAVTQVSPVNTVQAILSGGFGPATAGHPRPFGMPPYRSLLNDEEIAAVASYVRQSWGNKAGAVSALDVARVR